MFYNPSIRLPYNTEIADPASLRRWTSIAKKCMRFRPEERYGNVQELLADVLPTAQSTQFSGATSIQIPGQLQMAKLADGTVRPVRVLSIDMSEGKLQEYLATVGP